MAFINSIKGFLIGIALVIPGLSGSIFAVIVGLYEDLMAAISDFRKDPKGKLKFLWPIGLGAVIGVLLSTKLILWLCTAYPVQAYSLFIGLVIGVFPFVWKKIRQVHFRWYYLLLPIISFVIIYWLTKTGGGQQPENNVAIASLQSIGDAGEMTFAGLFSVSLMAIPGISGSIMLMVINQYGTVYHAVGQTFDALVFLLKGNWSQAAAAGQSVLLLVPFMIGAVIGLILIAKLMTYLLKHFESQVYYAVIGVLIAAIVTLFDTGVVPYAASLAYDISLIGVSAVVSVFATLGILMAVYLDKPKNN